MASTDLDGDTTMSNAAPSLDSGPTTILYFGYGSNLSTTQMAQRCPSSRPVGLAHLSGLPSHTSSGEGDGLEGDQHHQEGWRWMINERGYANVVPQTSAQPPATAHGDGDGHRWATWWRHGPQPSHAKGHQHQHQPLGVFGLLYAMTLPDLAALDVYEGWPRVYDRRTMKVRVCTWDDTTAAEDMDVSEGDTVSALVYVDLDAVTDARPRREYVGRMNRGIAEAMAAPWRLPALYVEAVMRPFIPAGEALPPGVGARRGEAHVG